MKSTALLACLTVALVSCSPKKEVSEEAPAAPEKTPPAAEAASVKVKLDTTLGDIVLELNPEKAPATVKNFLSYVDKGHYNGTVFHRVIDGFMIQGGGFAVEGDGLSEKATDEPVANEGRNGLKNRRGTIAMARTSDPNSATSQFFINHKDNVMLDYPNPDGHGYAVFGEVVEGLDVVDKIAKVPTTTRPLTMIHPVSGQKMTSPNQDVPVQNVVIESASRVTGE